MFLWALPHVLIFFANSALNPFAAIILALNNYTDPSEFQSLNLRVSF